MSKVISIVGPSGVGKAQPLDAKILTPNGYTTMGNINVGDEIYGEDGNIYNVTKITEQGSRESFELTFNDGSKCECCDEHLWTFSSMSHGKAKKKTKMLKDISVKDWWIDYCEPIKMSESKHQLDPYLVGVLLADGYLRGNSISFSTSEEYIVSKVSGIVKDMDLIINKNGGNNYTWVISDPNYNGSKFNKSKLKEELDRLKILGTYSRERFIPEEYKFDSIENRIKLMKGLFDCDGSVSEKENGAGSSITYSTTSTLLKDDISFVLDTLGIRHSLSSDNRGKEKYTSGVCWTIKIQIKDGDPLIISSPKHLEKWSYPKKNIHKRRKFKSMKSLGKKEMRCIETSNPTHLYLTDNCIVTHNSTAMRTIADNENVIIFRISEKPFPFRNKLKEWDSETKTGNYVMASDYEYVTEAIGIMANNYNKKVIIIEDSTFLMTDYFMTTAKQKGLIRSPLAA